MAHEDPAAIGRLHREKRMTGQIDVHHRLGRFLFALLTERQRRKNKNSHESAKR